MSQKIRGHDTAKKKSGDILTRRVRALNTTMAAQDRRK
jgi:hypothetical protein